MNEFWGTHNTTDITREFLSQTLHPGPAFNAGEWDGKFVSEKIPA
jgi:hypothetical protein